MERADIKRVLKEKGVAGALLEMPAVIEPIYKEMMEKTESDLSKQGKVNVDEQGNFSFGGRRIKLNEDGCAEITFSDAKITTNSVGIEVAYEDGNWQDWFSHISRDNGVVVNSSGNNGNASYYESTHLDNGSWSVRNASGVGIGEKSSYNKDGEYVPFQSTVEDVLNGFDSVSSNVIANYPNTAEWYQATRRGVQSVAERETNPEEQNRRRIAFLERRVSRLEADKKELLAINSRLTSMLEKSLDFMGQVKRSPVGKIFFSKGLKKYEEESKKLPEGRED